MQESERKETQLSAMRAYALVGQLGLVVAVPIVAGVGAGVWLSHRVANGKLLILAGIALGLIVGLLGAVRLLLREVPWNR